MNSKTELLENRIAELTVVVEADALDKSKRQAARQLSRRVNIPGFRKGKAPYNIIARYLGEGAILEEAIDKLGPDVYRDALDGSELEPYGPGALENVEPTEDQSGIVLTFHVPLVPKIEMGDYRAIRKDYEEPVIEDKQIEDAIEYLLGTKAEIEVKEGASETGDQVKLDVYGEQVVEEDAEDDSDNEPLFDQKDWTYVIGQEMGEPLPGFSDAVAGMSAGDERSFDLTIPDEDDYDEGLRGAAVTFTVTCHEVSSRDLPELTDDFVQSLNEVPEGSEQTPDPDAPTTVEEMRTKLYDDMLESATKQAETEYADSLLDEIVEISTVEYNEMMVKESIDNMMQQFEGQLSQQGIDLESYLKFTNMEEEKLRADYREPAIRRLERSLVLGELARAEGLEVSEDQITYQVRQQALQYAGGNAEMVDTLMQILNNDQGRYSAEIETLTQQTYDRIVAIAKGEEPEVGPVPFEMPEEAAPAAAEEDSAEGEAVAEVEVIPEATEEPSVDTEVEEEESAE